MPAATLSIDLSAIAGNWRALDRASAANVETAAVVKADAYGLGVERVAPVLAAAGARTFFVALAEEGVAVRDALGPGPDILVFAGYMDGDQAAVRQAGLIPLLNSPKQATAFARDFAGHPAGVQVDSGMNRLGLEPADVPAALNALGAPPRLVLSHLACADTPDHPQNRAQLAAFRDLLPQFGGAPATLAATGGILLGPAYHFAMTRPGIGVYGGAPYQAAAPAVGLSVPVIQTRALEPGDTVGYGATWTAARRSIIATLAAGYADGLIRALGAGAQVFAGATACPVVGRVSMDLITVDVTDLAEVPDTLALLGPDQGIDALADAAGTIGYEILTSLGARYLRQYKGG